MIDPEPLEAFERLIRNVIADFPNSWYLWLAFIFLLIHYALLMYITCTLLVQLP